MHAVSDRDAVRCGRISYTNVLPIYAAFDAGAVAFPGTLVCGVPSALNAMLLDGRLDLGPVSAPFGRCMPMNSALLPELCIGARDAVWSVVCVSSVPLDALDGATIAVTRESASGRELLRVLLERRYGAHVTFTVDDDPFMAAQRGEPALLIGDRALDARRTFAASHVYDLAQEWHAWTGLDIVFAVWAVRRDRLTGAWDGPRSKFFPDDWSGPPDDALATPLEVVSALPGAGGWQLDGPAAPAAMPPAGPTDPPAGIAEAFDALLAARRWGASNAAAVLSAAQKQREREPGFYAGYYDVLNFSFDERARAGLTRFVAELRAIGAIEDEPSTEPEATFVR